MLQRDTLMPKDHWKQYVSGREKAILSFELLANSSDISYGDKYRLITVIYTNRLRLLVGQYSTGYDINVLRETYIQVLHDLKNYIGIQGNYSRLKSFDDYIDTLWLVSFAILFELDKEDFKNLISSLGDAPKDALISQLIRRYLPEYPTQNKLLYPKPYRSLYQATVSDDNKEQESLIEKFLKHYYDNMERAYWHNIHIVQPSNFFGYWCFELAALVRVLHIPDDKFINNMYYPRDLVHQIYD
jgi:hypothetical protein